MTGIFKLTYNVIIIFFTMNVMNVATVYADAVNTPPNIKFIGQAVLPTGYIFGDTEVGGLSAITYDPAENIYYAISDDRSKRQPARFYSLKIEFTAGELTNESITLTDVIFLRDEHDELYERGTVDPEGIVLAKDGYLFVSSEKHNNQFIAKFTKAGKFISTLPIPDKVLREKDNNKGIRKNFGFESLTISPNGLKLTTAVENALKQDGPKASEKNNTLCRLFIYDVEKKSLINEKVYIADKIAGRGNKKNKRNLNGLVELLSINNKGVYYALERSYTDETGHIIKLYEVDVENGTDVSYLQSLSDDQIMPSVVPAKKRLIINFNDLGISVDNIEGMTFGPLLPDGTQSLIFLSDNNFHSEQVTQFIAFSIK